MPRNLGATMSLAHRVSPTGSAPEASSGGLLSSLAGMSMASSSAAAGGLPGGQPVGSADAQFVRQATAHLNDAERLSHIVRTARDVKESEWEDPTTLNPALAAAQKRLDAMAAETDRVLQVMTAAGTSAQMVSGGDGAHAESLLRALEEAEQLSCRMAPKDEDRAKLESLYHSTHVQLGATLSPALRRAASAAPGDVEACRRAVQLGNRAARLRKPLPQLDAQLGAAVAQLRLIEMEQQQRVRCGARCEALGMPPPEAWPPLSAESAVALMEQVAAKGLGQRMDERGGLAARLRAAEAAAEAAERRHREECRAGQQKIAALQRSLHEAEAARAAERTQVAAQQRAMAAQLQELRASQAALRTQVTQLEAEVAKRDRWLDGLAKPRGGGALGALGLGP